MFETAKERRMRSWMAVLQPQSSLFMANFPSEAGILDIFDGW
jgi:hypothetical protein